MERKRHPSGPAKRRATKLKKPLYTRSSSNKSASDNTLPDDIFLDSFDKFLYNDKQDLRAKKVLVKDIRASFNRDSSIDESDESYSVSASQWSHSERESEIQEDEDIENSDPVDEAIDTSIPNTSVVVENSNIDSSKFDSSHQIHQTELASESNKKDDERCELALSTASYSFIEPSSIQTPTRSRILSSSTPMLADKPKLSDKPRVVFYAEDSIHELSNVTEHNNESSLGLQLKGGKWRRTIYEIRKNKVTLSPRRTLEKLNEIKFCHGITLRRKSIYIKDIPDRKTINLGHTRQSLQNVTILDDAYVNVRPRLRSVRFQAIDEDSDKSASLTNSHVTLSESSCNESIHDDRSEHSTSNIDLSSNQNLLKAQLLQRCGQTDVLKFDEIYSTR